MPMKPREMEKLILADGWVFKSQVGSHRQYTHPTKPGKVTIPWHAKDLNKKRAEISPASLRIRRRACHAVYLSRLLF